MMDRYEELIKSIEEFAKVASEGTEYDLEKTIEAIVTPITEAFYEAAKYIKEGEETSIFDDRRFGLKYEKRAYEILNS